jgi:5-methylthioadenosine/S-adenosylhomocysteine deaminase
MACARCAVAPNWEDKVARTLIRNAIILTMDPEIGDLARGDVLIEDDRILRVGKRLRAGSAQIFDASRMIVMPGFVNAHLHSWQTGIRGIAGNWAIPQYLQLMHARIAPQFTAEDIYLANLVGALNQIANGATTIFDWCHNNATPDHTDGAIDGLAQSGIRAVFGHGSPKPDAAAGALPFTHIPHPRAEIARLAGGRLAGDGRITLAMAALGPDFSTFEVTEHDFRLAREFDILISAHVWGAPTRMNKDGYRRLAGKGLLGPDHNLVHGNYLGERELSLLVDHGVSVTVTPEVELQMSHGTPLTGRLRARGVRPSIGVDVESNISGDMFTVMRMTLQTQRALDNKAAARVKRGAAGALSITPREALEWATIEGARALRLDDRIGSLTPGKQADLIMIDADALNLFPVHNAIESVVFHANGANVDTVMVAGRILKKGGRLRYRGLADKKDRLRRSGRRILTKAGLPPFAPA